MTQEAATTSGAEDALDAAREAVDLDEMVAVAHVLRRWLPEPVASWAGSYKTELTFAMATDAIAALDLHRAAPVPVAAGGPQ